MRWLRRFRRQPVDTGPVPPLDIDALLHQVRVNPARFRIADERLRRHRALLVQRRKALANQSRRPTAPQLRNAGRLGPQLGISDFQQQIRDADNMAATGYDADLDLQIGTIDRALDDLRAILRGDA